MVLDASQCITGSLAALCRQSPAVARQFEFSAEERVNRTAVRDDPIGDQLHSPVRGIVHRYPDRVLLLPNFSCPSVCRFCFRKERIGKEPRLSDAELDTALEYIESHPEIFEVILSGGEPLLSFQGVQRIIDRLEHIDSVEVLRIHTRLPLTDPAAAEVFFDQEPLRFTKPLFLVIHCNHLEEITPQWKAFVRKAHDAGMTLLSQSVLLAGVNDSVHDLEALFRELVRQRVTPYYLHHPDQVTGTDHFRVSLEKGRKLFNQLRGRLSGIAIPRYILDVPGGKGKVSAEAEVISGEHRQFLISMPAGEVDYIG